MLGYRMPEGVKFPINETGLFHVGTISTGALWVLQVMVTKWSKKREIHTKGDCKEQYLETVISLNG
jgi:hypothetical protein